MATQAQIDANRRNSQKSTGPRTPEGKAAVSRNALKHGFRSRDVVLPGEDPDGEFPLLLEELTAEWQPDTLTDRTLVEDLAGVLWRQQRATRIERGTFIAAGEVATDKIWGRPTPPDPGQHHEIGTRILAEAYAIAAESPDRIHRHQDRLERSQARLLRQLESRQRAYTATERSNPMPTAPQALHPCGEIAAPAGSILAERSNPIATPSNPIQPVEAAIPGPPQTQKERSNPISPALQPGGKTIAPLPASESSQCERSNPIAAPSPALRPVAVGTAANRQTLTERSKPISGGIPPSDFYSLTSAAASRHHSRTSPDSAPNLQGRPFSHLSVGFCSR